MRTTSLRSAFVIGTTLLSIPAHLAAQELPPAGDIIERYVDAIGGREAVLAAFTARSVGEFTLPDSRRGYGDHRVRRDHRLGHGSLHGRPGPYR